MIIYIGYDPRDFAGYAVAHYSFRKYTRTIPIRGLILEELRKQGLYYRPTEVRTTTKGGKQLWDCISDAPMSTEFAITRFLVPHLAKTGWALFVDGDVMAIDNVTRIFDFCDPSKAIMCVQHSHKPEKESKMDGQVQTQYPRKNWSSVVLYNCDHPANKRLTVDMVNSLPGRDLHQFCWLKDNEIGELPQQFNYLVGYTHLNSGKTPTIVHFTSGLPDLIEYEQQEYADEWRAMLPHSIGAV